MQKILWIDTETTGTDPTANSIIEIAGIIDIDGKKVSEFDFFVRPHPDFLIDEKSIGIHNISIEQMLSFPETSSAYRQLLSVFGKYIDKFNREDKFSIAGQNVKFDLDFLSHFFMREKDVYLGSWIDFRKRVELYDITKAMQSLGFIQSESLSLEPLCKEFGIEIKPHNALSDISATRELYYQIKNNLKWCREDSLG